MNELHLEIRKAYIYKEIDFEFVMDNNNVISTLKGEEIISKLSCLSNLLKIVSEEDNNVISKVR